MGLGSGLRRLAASLLVLVGLFAASLLVFLFGGGAPLSFDESRVRAGVHPSVLVTEPLAMRALEARGFSLGEVLGARGSWNDMLTTSATYSAIVRVLSWDLAELARRPGVGDVDARKPGLAYAFNPLWLTGRDARFELVGFVPRLDRAFAEQGTCGELRLVYRLALTRPGRPGTRLPMTLSVIMVPRGDAAACAGLAKALLALPAAGSARVTAIADILRVHAAAPRRVEVNLQNLHGPATPRDGEDHAEYLLRSFDVTATGATERPLLDTPAEDLAADQRKELAAFIHEHFDDVDRGTLVLPTRFLAVRAISVSPRGLARTRNRPFATLFGKDADVLFADLPYASARIARSPRALLRRLDQGTCQGCHQSRAVAGFHLLGEERSGATFNALAVGHSNHLGAELAWREGFVGALAHGEKYEVPRPFAERATEGPGAHGERCGLGELGFASFACAAGLACKDDRHDELGACAPTDGNHEGDACERANVDVRPGASGDHLRPEPRQSCVASGIEVLRDACIPNETGFPGGMCSDRCEVVGELDGELACVDIPQAGYEEVCFKNHDPIEQCLATRTHRLRARACAATQPCRDDYACARAPNMPDGRGVCVPPYFVFQARVDGPRLDR